MGKGNTETDLVQTHHYSSLHDGIACKINIPVDDTKDDITVTLSRLSVQDKDQFVEEWGDRDGNLFVSQALCNSNLPCRAQSPASWSPVAFKLN